MIELYQFPWSPFCLVQRRILDFSGAGYRLVNVPSTDRSRIWKLTRERYYGVPILRDGREVIFETDDESQVLAKYLDFKLQLGLFPRHLEGLQSILWRQIENEIEGLTFKLNDVYFHEMVPRSEWLPFIRHKERKFGRGCLESWRDTAPAMLASLTAKLVPFEQMLLEQPYLLGDRPRFVDFDLHGMLANLLYSGHYRLPRQHPRLKAWYQRLGSLQFDTPTREKLRT